MKLTRETGFTLIILLSLLAVFQVPKTVPQLFHMLREPFAEKKMRTYQEIRYSEYVQWKSDLPNPSVVPSVTDYSLELNYALPELHPAFSDDVAVIPVFDRRVHIDPDSSIGWKATCDRSGSQVHCHGSFVTGFDAQLFVGLGFNQTRKDARIKVSSEDRSDASVLREDKCSDLVSFEGKTNACILSESQWIHEFSTGRAATPFGLDVWFSLDGAPFLQREEGFVIVYRHNLRDFEIYQRPGVKSALAIRKDLLEAKSATWARYLSSLTRVQ
jgi:hypothetical protein